MLKEDRVLKIAKEENRPVLAVFLSSGCPWSIKLNNEILENPQFFEKISPEPLLWKVCLDQTKENPSLLHKYGVQTCPSLLLLDPAGKEFARLEYLPMDAVGYVEMINSYIENFQEVCIALEQNVFEEEKWQSLYQKAQKLSSPCFQQVILEKGVQSERGSYFHLEKWISLLKKHKLNHPLVLKAKRKLLQRDQNAHFKIAEIEFQKLAFSRHKSRKSPEKTLAPIFYYMKKHGKNEPENEWKCELLIAEYFHIQRRITAALEHAQRALFTAPDLIKPQIEEKIALIKGESL